MVFLMQGCRPYWAEGYKQQSNHYLKICEFHMGGHSQALRARRIGALT